MRRLIAACLLAVLSLPGTSEAADPELKVAKITESRVYERPSSSLAIAGIRTSTSTESVSRVTVVLDGERITGEWVPKTTISASAKDFRRGSEVRVAVRRKQLLLEHPDGSIVTARIVERAEPSSGDDRARK